jgi:hypothetical protein
MLYKCLLCLRNKITSSGKSSVSVTPRILIVEISFLNNTLCIVCIFKRICGQN